MEALSPSWTDKVERRGYRFPPAYQADLLQAELPGTPVLLPDGVLCDSTTRKTLYYLKATLNTAFSPDYDFR